MSRNSEAQAVIELAEERLERTSFPMIGSGYYETLLPIQAIRFAMGLRYKKTVVDFGSTTDDAKLDWYAQGQVATVIEVLQELFDGEMTDEMQRRLIRLGEAIPLYRQSVT